MKLQGARTSASRTCTAARCTDKMYCLIRHRSHRKYQDQNINAFKTQFLAGNTRAYTSKSAPRCSEAPPSEGSQHITLVFFENLA